MTQTDKGTYVGVSARYTIKNKHNKSFDVIITSDSIDDLIHIVKRMRIKEGLNPNLCKQTEISKL